LNSYDEGENVTFSHDCFVCSVVAALLAVSCPAFWAPLDGQAGAQPNGNCNKLLLRSCLIDFRAQRFHPVDVNSLNIRRSPLFELPLSNDIIFLAD
jgi:hypothetical protein